LPFAFAAGQKAHLSSFAKATLGGKSFHVLP